MSDDILAVLKAIANSLDELSTAQQLNTDPIAQYYKHLLERKNSNTPVWKNWLVDGDPIVLSSNGYFYVQRDDGTIDALSNKQMTDADVTVSEEKD